MRLQAGMGEPRGKPSAGAAMRALRGARDLYVRGLRGLDRLLAAASPRRAGVGRPTSRVFGVGGRDSEEEEQLRDLVLALHARRGAAPSAAGSVVGSRKEDAGGAPPPVKRRRATAPLERISEDAAVAHPAS